MDIEVDSSGISGQLTWSGDELFDGDAIVDTTIVLRNIHDTSNDVSLETTNGSFSTDETRIIQGLVKRHLLKMERLKAKD